MTSELPAALRSGLEALAASFPGRDLAAASARLSADYHSGRGSRLPAPVDVAAYAIARMPATYAACAYALAEATTRASFAPRTVLDIGAGPGTATWAAVEAYPSLEAARLVDSHPGMISTGRTLAAHATGVLSTAEWIAADLAGLAPGLKADLVVASYALNELGAAEATRLATELYGRCTGLLVLVEPGSKGGFAVLAGARGALVAEGGRLAAPCPADGPCPMTDPDWCHFAARLPRLRAHKAAKSADVPFEDEPFSYLVVARPGIVVHPAEARILRRPQAAKPGTTFALCTPAGRETRFVPSRDRGAHRLTRRLGWGDAMPSANGETS
ncbi:MAG: hypothetical protein FD152_2902 [Xanthobacteraceae bacterium]|nr:MAG: hypothetical protein FD152_2902 [Xanthobacteraceae bacterium]